MTTRSAPGGRPEARFRALVIQLGQTPRNPGLLTQLQEFGITASAVSAVDGRRWVLPFEGVDVDFSSFQVLHSVMPSGSEVGCALSHLACYQLAAESGDPWTLILEDDAVLTPFFATVAEVLETRPTDTPQVITLFAGGSTMRPSTASRVGSLPAVTVARYNLPPSYAIGYAINRCAVLKAAKWTSVTGFADWPPFMYAFDFSGVYPWPVQPLGAEVSDIEASRGEVRSLARTRSALAARIARHISFLRPANQLVWKSYLGGWAGYFSRIFVPNVRVLMLRPRQKRLANEIDSPLLR
jgi:hypothetical protein